ncbi:MAG TPA: hypothetical protein VIC84_04820 [Blastocatellia bacterium]|jgi:hypothetical protein
MNKKIAHTHAPADSNGKCPRCGKRIGPRKPSTPMPADAKLDRATSSAIKALTQIREEQGAGAEKAARVRVTAAIAKAGKGTGR